VTLSLSEVCISLASDVMGLQQVIDFCGQLLLQCSARHLSLGLEEIVDKDFDETFLKFFIRFDAGRHVVKKLNLRLLHRLAIFTRCLIMVSDVKSEHQFIRDLVEEGDISAELRV
jgi:hypothetical protein